MFFLKEKIYDLILLESKSISYFQFRKNKKTKEEKIEIELFKNGIFQKDSVESVLLTFIKKYKFNILGIIFHLPNILYQKIVLPRSSDPLNAITNYLKVSSPLSLDKYSFFFKENRQHSDAKTSAFEIIFVPKEIIDSLLKMTEKHNLVPLFITPSIEAVYQYLVGNSFIYFGEEYVFFIIDEYTLTVMLIKNFRIEKVIIDEINIENIGLSSLIGKFYSFLKVNLIPESKIIFFNIKEISQPLNIISHQQIFFKVKPKDIILEGSKIIFERAFNDRDIIDFSPVKPRNAYFLNKLPSIIIFLAVYLFLIFFIISGVFLVFNFKFNGEIKNLNSQLAKFQVGQKDAKNQIFQLLEITKNLDIQKIENFDKMKKILSLNNLQKVTLNLDKSLIFSLKVKKKDVAKEKNRINKNFPDFDLVEESTSKDEVILIYRLK